MNNETDEPIMLTCPHCYGDFDFLTLNKNMWASIGKYMVVGCPICGEDFKIDMEE